MQSVVAKLSIVLAVLLFSAPAFAQSQTSSNSDPFSGLAAVESDQMSAASGERTAGVIGEDISANFGTGNCDAGAQCGGSAPSNDVGTTTRDVSGSGNTIRINVTAVNIQTSIVGPSIINTNGGSNSAGGGN